MSSPCSNCGKTSFIRDDVSGDLICSSCGVVQQFDQFDAQIGGLDGPQGTFIHVGTAGSGSLYSYRERKLFAANNSIDELTCRLGLSSKSVDIRTMISSITEGEFGQGEWFHVLIGACAYVVMRKDDRPLPMAEIASAVGCDVYELGRMILRVIDFLDLRPDFPEFDIVHSLERTVKNCASFASVGRGVKERMQKQGVFLIQCAVKWFLSTGRRPMPLVVAVLVFVAELNGVGVRMEDLAGEVHAMVSTCRARYKELLETLVKVAQVLPWGKDVTVKNIVKNAPFVIQYMERKSMLKPGAIREKRKDVDRPGVDLEDVVAECLRHDGEFEYGVDGVTSRKDSRYFSLESNNADRRLGVGDVDRLQISPECLSMLYKKFLDENRCAEALRRNGNAPKRRSLRVDLQECREWWEGKSELSKKLLLKRLLEKDVGVDTMPPSFVTGQLKCKMRRERINAAKVRIKRIMDPLDADLGDTEIPGPVDSSYPGRKRKKRKGMVVDDVDWEDLIIETLVLHQVKEEEIEKGHYNTLLDLHVFNSGIV
ncbi:Transcription initiation factor IIB-1 [Spatholobus suberectus]|nr:Transcription initiation factor IIB-1 [Spatholobus suberectus]